MTKLPGSEEVRIDSLVPGDVIDSLGLVQRHLALVVGVHVGVHKDRSYSWLTLLRDGNCWTTTATPHDTLLVRSIRAPV